ncbi:MAG: hypothetical protein EXR35_06315 [Limnohabitans sp.]|nr:hypothetical protein [Limnohabitans sp.]
MSYGSALATSYSKPYWDGLVQGLIRIQRCIACGNCQDFPQGRCRHCLSENLAWIDASGSGTLLTFSSVHRAPSPEFSKYIPYIVGMVSLPEGIQLMSRILVEDESELVLDMPMSAKPIQWPDTAYVLGFEPKRKTS